MLLPLLLILMAGLPGTLSDNVQPHKTLLCTKYFKISEPVGNDLDGRLTKVESSIKLTDKTRPGQCATLKLKTPKGSIAIGLDVDRNGEPSLTCRAQDERGHVVDQRAFPATTPPPNVTVNVDISHSVDVRFEIAMSNPYEYELRGFLLSKNGRSAYLFCSTKLEPVYEASLSASLTSVPPLTPKGAKAKVRASFQPPKVLDFKPMGIEHKPQVYIMEAKRPLRTDNPKVKAEQTHDKYYIEHQWTNTTLHPAAQPQPGPSTSRGSTPSLRSSGSSNSKTALISPTPGSSSRSKLHKWLKNPFSKKT
ncbi:hypothetical protein RI367_005352 [Sorochytrium milnesiophthora]